jgi:hypothetical protein
MKLGPIVGHLVVVVVDDDVGDDDTVRRYGIDSSHVVVVLCCYSYYKIGWSVPRRGLVCLYCAIGIAVIGNISVPWMVLLFTHRLT